MTVVSEKVLTANVLDRLARGETVVLGDFSDQVSDATEADVIAAQAYELVAGLRGSATFREGPANRKVAEILECLAQGERVSIYDFGDGATEEEAAAIRAVLHASALDLRAG